MIDIYKEFLGLRTHYRGQLTREKWKVLYSCLRAQAKAGNRDAVDFLRYGFKYKVGSYVWADEIRELRFLHLSCMNSPAPDFKHLELFEGVEVPA